ncbi:MAG TPA: winged helix-turn-helix domain-containing protein [Blastocatellia bacterium]|nr:winged helix-turn-helix domain-containing protein [Blastocatellia bacterium]
MTKQAGRLYEFGPYRLDVAERLLLRDEKHVELTAKVFDLLVLLVENQGKLLEKSYLLEVLWPGSFVEEVNLSVNVSALRKALGEQASAPQYIETIPKRGYRFIGNVTALAISEEETISHRAAPPIPEIPSSEWKATTADDYRPAADAETPLADSGMKSLPDLSGHRLTFSSRLMMILALLIVTALAAGAYLLWRASQPRNTKVAGSRTIAVLPFKTLTSNDADQAMGIGMADALITRLGSLHQIIVRPTSAVLKYSDGGVDPITVGRELGVEAVLDGRVQREDKKIRVTARLLRVEDGSSLWAGKFDDFFTNVFALQDSISEKMAEALSLQLTRDEQQLLAKRDTENTEAYQLYIQGQYSGSLTPDKVTKAVGFFQAAIEKDPEYAKAYAGLAEAYLSLSEYGIEVKENRERARVALTKAIELEPDLAEAYNALANIEFIIDWDLQAAERAFQRAIEIAPKLADAHRCYGLLLSALARHTEAIREMELARQFNPISVLTGSDYASILCEARRYDEAIEMAKKTIEMDPRSASPRRWLARAYVMKSMYAEAIAELEKEVELGGLLRKPAILGYAYALAGNRAEAQRILQERIQSEGKASFTYHGIALIYTALGDKDRAFQCLEKAFQEKETNILFLKTSPEWDLLRPDPRFDALLGRLPF